MCVGGNKRRNCNGSLNLQSSAVIMGYLLIGNGSNVLLRNGKSAQQMCWEVKVFPLLIG